MILLVIINKQTNKQTKYASLRSINTLDHDDQYDIDVSDTLTLDSSGNGLVAVSGSSGTLDATLTGNGQVSVYGLQGNAKIDVSGNGPVFIGGSETTAITGTHTSFSPLFYQGASCDVTGESAFSPGCVKETTPPVPSTTASSTPTSTDISSPPPRSVGTYSDHDLQVCTDGNSLHSLHRANLIVYIYCLYI